MTKTLGCADVGYECVYRITTDDDEQDSILDTTVRHAKLKHPELVINELEFRKTLKSKIKSLLIQSNYTSDKS